MAIEVGIPRGGGGGCSLAMHCRLVEARTLQQLRSVMADYITLCSALAVMHYNHCELASSLANHFVAPYACGKHHIKLSTLLEEDLRGGIVISVILCYVFFLWVLVIL